jgi:hypothetical protein
VTWARLAQQLGVTFEVGRGLGGGAAAV